MRIDFSKVETIDYEKINRMNKAREKEKKEKERRQEWKRQYDNSIFGLPRKTRVPISVCLSANNILTIYLMNYCLPVSRGFTITAPWGIYAGYLIGFVDEEWRHNKMLWEGR
jgi:hypothetical protein